MDSYTNAQTSEARRSIRPLAGYRVMARHRDQSQSLVTLAENPRQAAIFAKAFCDALDAGGSRDGIVSVRTEEWVGTLIEGEWKPVSLSQGGFLHRFATQFANRNDRNGDHRTPSLPKAGDKVECVLLAEKTRKDGWKAKLVQRGMEGPITNTTDVPKSAKPGQMVTLRVGAISHDGKRIQFHWQQADNPDCR
jgi:hypothetical protein